MKKNVTILLFALFLTMQVFAQTATPPSSGDGSSGVPYQIATLENLYWLSQQQNNSDGTGPYWSRSYIQTADIDASASSGWSGGGWTPIGNSSTNFTGNYDGGGYEIIGLYINRSSDYQGMFGYTSGSTIKNLGLTNSNITGGNNFIAALVAYCKNSTVNNCFTTGSVYGATVVAGLVGRNDNSAISSCYSTAAITGTAYDAGGLVGHNYNNGTISNCYTTGSIFGTYTVGGFVGYNESGTITNCYSNGFVSAGNGFVYIGSNTITNSFWDTETSGQTNSMAGTGKTTSQMKTSSTFSGASWDFTSTWARDDNKNGGYPYLQWQTFPNTVTLTDGSSFSQSLTAGQTNQAIGRFALKSNATGSDFNGVWIKLFGTRSGASNFKLWESADNTFDSGTDTQIGSTVASDPGSNDSVWFGGLGKALATTDKYYFLTCDLSSGATGRIIPVIPSNKEMMFGFSTLGSNINNSVLSSSSAPATQASNIISFINQATQITIGWTNGDGSSRAVFIAQTNSGSPSPSDNTEYTANAAFGSGTQIGSTGWYCVYNGTGSSVTISNLTLGLEYRIMVVEYNGFGGNISYNTTTATNNPVNITTASSINNALYFDGTNDYINLNPVPDLYNTDFTFETWFKLVAAPGGDRFIFGFGPSSGTSMYVFISGSTFDVGYYGQDLRAGSLSFDGLWHHVAFTYNNTSHKGTLYLDGSEIGNLTFSTYLSATTTIGRIGSPSYRNDQNFMGELDETRIWNVERTQTEIQTNMSNLNLDPSTAGLLAYYHYNEGTGGADNTGINMLIDETSNNYSGTLTNFALTGSSSNWVTNADPLPVEMTDFSAKTIDDKVELSWATATEVNNHGFEVQRKILKQSTEGGLNYSWEKIGFVSGAGNSNSPKSYSFTDQPTGGTSFSYRIKQIDNDGKYKYYDAITVTLTASQKAELLGNYPNPFNPSTAIKFYIPNNSDVSIKIYDMLGREVTTLVNKQTEAGYHVVYWNGNDRYGNSAASGVYVYRLTAGSFSQTKKMALLK